MATEEAPFQPVAVYYNWLSRYVQFTNLLKFGDRYAAYTMHKTLCIPEEKQSSYPRSLLPLYINDLALAVANLPLESRVLDAGCGFGGTIFRWHHKVGGRYDGLTLSRVQWKVAQREAHRRGIASQCRFYLKSYDEPIPTKYDAVVAIESLIHSPYFAGTVENLAKALHPRGKLVIVDDIPPGNLAEQAERELKLLKRHWKLYTIPSAETYCTVFAQNSLQVIHDSDLTPLVRTKGVLSLRIVEALCTAAYTILPLSGLRSILSSYIGAMALESLYRKGLIRYRLLVAQKTGVY